MPGMGFPQNWQFGIRPSLLGNHSDPYPIWIILVAALLCRCVVQQSRLQGFGLLTTFELFRIEKQSGGLWRYLVATCGYTIDMISMVPRSLRSHEDMAGSTTGVVDPSYRRPGEMTLRTATCD